MEPSPQGSSDEASSSRPSQVPVTFEFVMNGHEKNHTQVRRHAMRASWRERKRHSSKNILQNASTSVRDLAPAPAPTASTLPEKVGDKPEVPQDSLSRHMVSDEDILSTSTANQEENQTIAYEEPVPEQENQTLVFTDKAHTINRGDPGFQGKDTWNVLSRTIGSNILDAMSSYPYQIQPQDLELVHHWVGAFPKMMFGTDMDSASHHHHSDTWIPLEFSNEASFHGALAYAAAHLGHLRGDPMPALATMHNLKAIEIINKWLHDPVMMISDAAIAAVMRQTTLENWWGNIESVKIHREGLKRMIELRGGLFSLRSNWRLEQTFYALLLIKEPYWFCPSQHRPIFPPVPYEPNVKKPPSTYQDQQHLRSTCQEFVNFFNSLKPLRATRPEISSISENGRYPFVEFAITRLKSFSRYPFPVGGQEVSPHTHIEETIRFVTLLYIAVTWRDCLTLPETCGNDLGVLNSALEAKGNIRGLRWVNSIENMFLVVITGPGAALISPSRCGFVLQLMDVARLLDLPSWMAIRNMLFDILLEPPVEGFNAVEWNAETLFTEIDGRY